MYLKSECQERQGRWGKGIFHFLDHSLNGQSSFLRRFNRMDRKPRSHDHTGHQLAILLQDSYWHHKQRLNLCSAQNQDTFRNFLSSPTCSQSILWLSPWFLIPQKFTNFIHFFLKCKMKIFTLRYNVNNWWKCNQHWIILCEKPCLPTKYKQCRFSVTSGDKTRQYKKSTWLKFM